MKKYFIAILLSGILTQNLFAQSNQEKIAGIDKSKKEIDNNIPTLHKIENKKDTTGYSYTYTNGNELKLIAIYYKDKNTDKHVEWYFSKGK